LGPKRRPGEIVVPEYPSIHKAGSIRGTIAARHCQLLFLPPYLLAFTPIERVFSKSKTLLRGLGARARDAVPEAICLAVEAITREDAVT
jgi:transposase